MDQSKTMISHFGGQNRSKTFASVLMLKTNLTAVLAHGRKPFVHVHTWFPCYAHDSNAVVSSIMKVLRDVEQNGGPPPKLRIQADNCWRENKNRFVFALAALLVKFGFFQEVEFGFMLQGHTHTDVDAVFSHFSRKLRMHDASTMSDVFAIVASSQQEHQCCTFMEEIDDWREAVMPYLVKSMTGHTRPHSFRFYMEEDNPVFQWKQYCNSPEWSSPVYCFNRDLNGGYDGPQWPFEPRPVRPDMMNRDFVGGTEGVKMFVSWLDSKKHEWAGMKDTVSFNKENALSHWKNFLAKIESFDDVKTEDQHL